MKSRTAAKLLPVALAVATVTAIGAPTSASAEEAPPPQAEGPYSEQDCTQALQILSYFKLLPNQPDVGRVLCSINATTAPEDMPQQNAHADEPNSAYLTEPGQSAQQNGLLGLPAEWIQNLTAYVAAIDHVRPHSDTSGQD
ncbi:hypothetical protein [Actinomadura sp. 6K520]|uniref:hypothetical protein n=1 Tax=Actinomadura sp. 6K520 TaxID=2530364 RepID=UPI001042F08E|nr:hypothetical protein [Actinomadura sp. 6K520]TDE21989.1 hypothetical protein E1289_30515 [Actinomadura sp. 6K520]